VLFDHFWVEAGDQPLPESGAEAEAGRVQFVATPSVQGHLRSLARASLTRRYPVLLQVTSLQL
jgi:midasin (ATPase involved in ribosome maturation)